MFTNANYRTGNRIGDGKREFDYIYQDSLDIAPDKVYTNTYRKKNPNDLIFVKQTLEKKLMDLANVVPKPKKLMSPHASPLKVDYVDICEKETLRPLEILNKKAIILIAVWVYGVRLVDNLEISF